MVNQASENSQIYGVHLAAVSFFLRCFQDHRMSAKARIIDQQSKWLQTQTAPADMGMPINAAALRLLAVVQVKGPQAFQADYSIKFSHRFSIFAFRCQGIARGKDVASVQAHTQAIRFRNQL